MTVVAWIWIALSVVGAITFSRAGLVRRPDDLDRRLRSRFEGFWLRFAIILLVLLIIVRASIAWRDHQAPARRGGARKGDDRSGRRRDSDAPVLAEEDAGRAGDAEADAANRARAISTICPGISSSARPAPAKPPRWSIPA